MRKFIFAELFAFIAVSTVLGKDYNETLARYKLWPMASAVYSDHPELCIKDNFANAEFKAKYVIECDFLTIDTCSGLSLVSHSDKAIILSFQGSESYIQILMEGVGLLLIPITPFSVGGNVNKYFLDGFNGIWDAGMKDDFLALRNANPDYEVWVTGLSLGGAMASLTAATISKNGLAPQEKIKLITFGEPRVGDSQYATIVDTLVPYSFRLVHANDAIPHIPPKGMLGYYHHVAEVWYNNTMIVGSNYTICDSDGGQDCSKITLQTNYADHLIYFNLNYLFAVNGCPGYNPYR